MHKNIKKRSLSIMVSLSILISVLPTVGFADDGITEINIYHTNDTHARVGATTDKEGKLTNIGFAKFKEYIDLTSKDVDGKLILDAGDTLHGQSFATLEQGESVAKVMKAVGYDAISPGNHDFNYGQDKLKGLGKTANTKILAGNVKDSKGELKYDSTLVKEIEGVKVGVFGLATNETAYKTNPNNVTGLNFGTDEEVIKDAQDMVKDLEKQGCDIIVGVAHLGIDNDSSLKSTELAKKVDGIDLIIDGHSHSDKDEYQKVDDTIITSTGQHFENAGLVSIKYDTKNDKLVELLPQEISAKEFEKIAEDKEVSEVIENIKKGQETILNKVIGNTPILLDGERSSVRFGHTNLGRLMTNSMLTETNADIALTNGGGIRASIDVGDITKGEVLSVLPFGNYIVTIEATGQNIIDALNHGFEVGAGKFPHFAGMDVKVKEIKSKDTIKYEVKSITIDGKPIDKKAKYTVATNDFMAVGGDEYTMFKDCKKLNEFAALDEALINHIEKTGDKGIKEANESKYLTIENVTDIDKHWAKKEIEEFLSKGYVSGYDDDTFRPNNSITRAEFVRIVNNVFGFTEKGSIDFKDVKAGTWYYNDISIGVKKGYISGYGDKTFKPNDNITREEAANIVATITKLKGDGKLSFKDSDKISSWAKTSVDALSDNKIILGYEDNTFRPQSHMTRAESVSTLSRVAK